MKVPIEQQIEALEWLRSQTDNLLLPRCFFSGRDSGNNNNNDTPPLIQHSSSNVNGNGDDDSDQKLLSVAGLGSAVSFRHLHPFSLDHWHSIKRYIHPPPNQFLLLLPVFPDSLSVVSISVWEFEFGSQKLIVIEL